MEFSTIQIHARTKNHYEMYMKVLYALGVEWGGNMDPSEGKYWEWIAVKQGRPGELYTAGNERQRDDYIVRSLPEAVREIEQFGARHPVKVKLNETYTARWSYESPDTVMVGCQNIPVENIRTLIKEIGKAIR